MLMLVAFALLSASILSVWLNRDFKIWGSLLFLSLLSGIWIDSISWVGLCIFALLTLLWIRFSQKPHATLFFLLVIFTLSLKFQLFPGFTPILITPQFKIGFPMALAGLLPLALIVPVSRTKEEWIRALKGFAWGLVGIGVMAILATVAKATHWQPKIPSFMGLRTWSNLILTCIPEEAFYRGFIQATLCSYLKNVRWGNILSIFFASAIFTGSHVYWNPNPMILAFVFIASVLYGGVYLYSRRIESAILTHFCLNLIHMVFFHYHAM